jgi:hypothetical protein
MSFRENKTVNRRRYVYEIEKQRQRETKGRVQSERERGVVDVDVIHAA